MSWAVLWQARIDIMLALAGMCLAGIGLGIEISECRRLTRMARECEAGKERHESRPKER